MPLNRPFIDSNAKRGQPKLTSRSVNQSKIGKSIRFELFSKTHLKLKFFSSEIYVTKRDGIRLAHWLLDECSK